MSIKRWLSSSWMIYSKSDFLGTKKYKIVKLVTTLLFGITILLAIKYVCPCLVVLKVLQTVDAENFNFGNIISEMPTDGLWSMLVALVIACCLLYFYKKEQSKLLTNQFIKDENETDSEPKEKLTFGRRFLLYMLTTIILLGIAFIALLPVIFIAMSYYQTENAALLDDVVVWNFQQDFSSIAVISASFYVILSAFEFIHLAHKNKISVSC